MGHGPAGGDAVDLVREYAGRTRAAADICGSCAQYCRVRTLRLREPNSSTTRPSAARTIRLAFVAMRLWWFIVRRRKVSSSCAWMAGRVGDHDGLAREHGRPLRHGPDVARELEVAQVVEEGLREHAPCRAGKRYPPRKSAGS